MFAVRSNNNTLMCLVSSNKNMLPLEPQAADPLHNGRRTAPPGTGLRLVLHRPHQYVRVPYCSMHVLVESLVGISSRRPTRSDRLISPPKKGSPSAQVEQLGTSLDVNAEDAPDPVCDVDVEFLTHVRFLQAVKTYKVLKYSIQRRDIGLFVRISFLWNIPQTILSRDAVLMVDHQFIRYRSCSATSHSD